MKTLLSFLCLIACSTSYGIDKKGPPSFAVLVSTKEESTIAMNCQPSQEKAKYLKCTFSQKLISRKKDALDEASAEIKSVKTDDEKAKFVDEFKKSCRSDQNTNQKAVNGSQDVLNNATYDIWKQGCACIKTGTFTCIEQFLTESAKLKSKTCRVIVNEFSLNFKPVSKDKYITDAEPFGGCNVVNIAVLERDGKSRNWKFTQTRVSADSTPMCAYLELNKPSIFLESYFVDFPGCEYISLGV